ncbi:MAG TPA: VacJ family lipoprotein [Aliiroseovarius sp.]|nr:VacJ family lipoprotein [Aliiroseovarius sp.]
MKISQLSRIVPALLALMLVSACATQPQPVGINDPNEAANRKVHAFNKAFDSAFFGPAANAYGSGVPEPVRARVQDFASNTSLPSLIVNNLLQVRLDDAGHNFARLLLNTTLGIGGLFDVASDVGLEERTTDFGETLHVWGFKEGKYVVMPFFGPSTTRDATGTVVDFFTNPLSYSLPTPERYVPTAASVVARFGDRYTYGATIDDLMYSSEDPYSTMRLFYLDARRYELSGGESGDDLYDIYEEAYE